MEIARLLSLGSLMPGRSIAIVLYPIPVTRINWIKRVWLLIWIVSQTWPITMELRYILSSMSHTSMHQNSHQFGNQPIKY